MKRTYLVFLALILLASCHSLDGWNEVLSSEPKLSLISQTAVEEYRFHNDGDVLATFGTKEELTAPLLSWSIVEGRLRISDGISSPEELTFLGMSGSVIKARRASGEVIEYKVSPR